MGYTCLGGFPFPTMSTTNAEQEEARRVELYAKVWLPALFPEALEIIGPDVTAEGRIVFRVVRPIELFGADIRVADA